MPTRPNIFRSQRTPLRRGSQFLPALLTVALLVLGPLALVAYACSGGHGGSWGDGNGGSWARGTHGGSGSTGGAPNTPAQPSTPSVPSAPSTPSTPSTPGTPTTPNTPAEPQQPSTPSEPAEPSTPQQPQTPDSPGSDSTDGPNGNANNPPAEPSAGEAGEGTGQAPAAPAPSAAETPAAPATGEQPAAPGGEVVEEPGSDASDDAGDQRGEKTRSERTGAQVAGIASSLAAPINATIQPAVAVLGGDSGAKSERSSRTAKDADQLRERTTIARAVDGIPLIFRAALLLLIFASSVLAIVSLRERRRATAVARIALLDHLTGLSNREGFDRQMAIEWQRALRHDRPLGLVFVDLDDFKSFNDTFGHVAGDRLLREVSAAIVATARASDFTARLGGDEFVVICPDADDEGLARLVERLRVESAGMSVTLSIGAASRLETDQSSDDLVHRADIAMYSAKGGRRRGTSSTNPMLGSMRRS